MEMADQNSIQNGKVPFPFGRQTNRAWREQALTRVAEMTSLLDRFDSQPMNDGNMTAAAPHSTFDDAILGHLDEAFRAAQQNSRWWDMKNGAVIERAMSNLDAAEALLLWRAPLPYLKGQVPHLWAHIRQHLPAVDPRRLRVQEVIGRSSDEDLDDNDKELLIQGVRAASSEARREFTRVRSFRNTLLTTAVLMTVIAVAVAVWGSLRPNDLAICFTPATGRVCPAGGDPLGTDMFLLEFIGMVSGAVSGSFSLRHMSGTSTRLGLPVALAVLKLPTGALTAFLGLLLMRGEFVPGLSNLDSSAQILAWAVVFGAAQQLVTGLIDKQADTVLNQIAGKAHQTSPIARDDPLPGTA
jgi:hypothetical protein